MQPGRPGGVLQTEQEGGGPTPQVSGWRTGTAQQETDGSAEDTGGTSEPRPGFKTKPATNEPGAT